MSDGSYSPYQSTGRGAPGAPASGGSYISNAGVRVMCGIVAPLAFACAAPCFYFLVHPFGTNPPPKEVALTAGIVFSCFGLFMAGMAVFYRGTIATPGLDYMKDRRQAVPPRQWSPANVPPGAVSDPRSLLLSRNQPPRRGRRGEVFAAVALLAILIGPVIGYIAYQRQQVLKMGKPQPQVMKVADLGRKGPGDNIHVKITDFEFGKHYMTRSKGGNWIDVCLAAFPKGKGGDPKALKVVVRTGRVPNEVALRDFSKKAEIEGVVVNSIYESENDKEYMSQAYPGTDTSAIWVVQENYTFPNESEIKTMYAISSGVIGLAVFCGLGMVVRKMS